MTWVRPSIVARSWAQNLFEFAIIVTSRDQAFCQYEQERAGGVAILRVCGLSLFSTPDLYNVGLQRERSGSNDFL